LEQLRKHGTVMFFLSSNCEVACDSDVKRKQAMANACNLLIKVVVRKAPNLWPISYESSNPTEGA